jgi:hypothetical protein
MSELSSKILQNIKEQKIVPVPKWKILLRNRVVFSLSLISAILGIISIAVMLHVWFSPFEGAQPVGILGTASNIPYLWFAVILIFLFVAYHNFVHSEGGYRWKTLKMLLLAITISLIAGVGLFVYGIGRIVNVGLLSTVPGYSQFGDTRGRRWMSVEDGRIAGRITKIHSESSFVLSDMYGEIWNVNLAAPEALTPTVTSGTFVKVLGQKEREGEFTASEVIEWEGKGKGMQGNGNRLRIHR